MRRRWGRAVCWQRGVPGLLKGRVSSRSISTCASQSSAATNANLVQLHESGCTKMGGKWRNRAAKSMYSGTAVHSIRQGNNPTSCHNQSMFDRVVVGENPESYAGPFATSNQLQSKKRSARVLSSVRRSITGIFPSRKGESLRK